jgi:hypothetical protein
VFSSATKMRIFRFKVTFFLRPYGFDPSKDDSLRAKLSIIKAYFDNLIKIRPDLLEKGTPQIHVFTVYGLANLKIFKCKRHSIKPRKAGKKIGIKQSDSNRMVWLSRVLLNCDSGWTYFARKKNPAGCFLPPDLKRIRI